jgi:hypothetical protein
MRDASQVLEKSLRPSERSALGKAARRAARRPDQNERDHDALSQAVPAGELVVESEV